MSFLSVLKAFASGTAKVVTAAPVIEGVTQVVAPQAVPFEQQLVGIGYCGARRDCSGTR